MGLIQEIETAYESRNLLPCFGDYLIKREDASYVCPMTALAVDNGEASLKDAPEKIMEDVYAWALRRYGRAWTCGFMVAYDGHEATDNNPNYIMGHCAGSIVRKKHLES